MKEQSKMLIKIAILHVVLFTLLYIAECGNLFMQILAVITMGIIIVKIITWFSKV